MSDDIYHMDIDKLESKLKEQIENPPEYLPNYRCPCRGLTGDLSCKMGAYMAGCMHHGLTEEDWEEVKKIQLEYDRLHKTT